jgi:hypothetical protein
MVDASIHHPHFWEESHILLLVVNFPFEDLYSSCKCQGVACNGYSRTRSGIPTRT